MELFKLACADCITRENLRHSTSRVSGRCEFCGKEDDQCRLAKVAHRRRLLR